jgi:hypothetical protein
MSENGLRSYGFHSSDPSAAAVMDALTHERASSPAFAPTGPRIVKIFKQLLSPCLSDGLSALCSYWPFLLHTINWTSHSQ